MQSNEEKRLELIMQARILFEDKKLSKTEICNELGISLKRLRKYLNGEPVAVSRHGGRGRRNDSPLDEYLPIIFKLVEKGTPYINIFQELVSRGYSGKRKTLYGFCERTFGSKRRGFELLNKGQHFILRRSILDHILSGKPLDAYDKQWVFSLHPELFEIRDAVSTFRAIMEQRSESRFLSWIRGAPSFNVPKVKAFCNGLLYDLDAVLNAIKCSESNAVLEGNVNRLKMIKRDMYGRAGYELLKAKVLHGVEMG